MGSLCIRGNSISITNMAMALGPKETVTDQSVDCSRLGRYKLQEKAWLESRKQEHIFRDLCVQYQSWGHNEILMHVENLQASVN